MTRAGTIISSEDDLYTHPARNPGPLYLPYNSVKHNYSKAMNLVLEQWLLNISYPRLNLPENRVDLAYEWGSSSNNPSGGGTEPVIDKSVTPHVTHWANWITGRL